VVLGKQLARKKICPPKTKKTGPSKSSSNPAPFSLFDKKSSMLPHHSTTQRPGPSTGSHIVEIPTGEHAESSGMPFSPTAQMASPSPLSTPIVPTVAMGSPTPYMPTDASMTPTQVNVILQRSALRRDKYAARGLASSEPQPASLSRGGNTARCSRPGPPRGRGWW
jgi:hypothetical protein